MGLEDPKVLFFQNFQTYIYSKKKYLQHKPHTYTQLPPAKYLCKPLGYYPQLENHCVGYGTKKKKRKWKGPKPLVPRKYSWTTAVEMVHCVLFVPSSNSHYPSLISWFLHTTNTSSILCISTVLDRQRCKEWKRLKKLTSSLTSPL